MKFFPGFPKAPPNLLNYYSKKYNISYGFGKIGEAKRKMAADGDRRRTCELELHDIEVRVETLFLLYTNTYRRSFFRIWRPSPKRTVIISPIIRRVILPLK